MSWPFKNNAQISPVQAEQPEPKDQTRYFIPGSVERSGLFGKSWTEYFIAEVAVEEDLGNLVRLRVLSVSGVNSQVAEDVRERMTGVMPKSILDQHLGRRKAKMENDKVEIDHGLLAVVMRAVSEASHGKEGTATKLSRETIKDLIERLREHPEPQVSNYYIEELEMLLEEGQHGDNHAP